MKSIERLKRDFKDFEKRNQRWSVIDTVVYNNVMRCVRGNKKFGAKSLDYWGPLTVNVKKKLLADGFELSLTTYYFGRFFGNTMLWWK